MARWFENVFENESGVSLSVVCRDKKSRLLVENPRDDWFGERLFNVYRDDFVISARDLRKLVVAWQNSKSTLGLVDWWNDSQFPVTVGDAFGWHAPTPSVPRVSMATLGSMLESRGYKLTRCRFNGGRPRWGVIDPTRHLEYWFCGDGRVLKKYILDSWGNIHFSCDGVEYGDTVGLVWVPCDPNLCLDYTVPGRPIRIDTDEIAGEYISTRRYSREEYKLKKSSIAIMNSLSSLCENSVSTPVTPPSDTALKNATAILLALDKYINDGRPFS